MAMASSVGEVREGFLCPMCMKDLGTVTQLQGHFEEEHSAEDKDVLHQLRGVQFFTEFMHTYIHVYILSHLYYEFFHLTLWFFPLLPNFKNFNLH